jgi:hypothetical protein
LALFHLAPLNNPFQPTTPKHPHTHLHTHQALSTSIGPIISLLDEPDTLTKRTGLHLLSQLQPRTLLVAVLPRVLALLGDNDGEVRRAVLPVLRALPPDALEDEAHAAHLLSFTGVEQRDWRVRATALYALMALPAPLLAEELDGVLAQALVEEEPSGLRFAALDVLQSLLRRVGGGGGCGGLIPRTECGGCDEDVDEKEEEEEEEKQPRQHQEKQEQEQEEQQQQQQQQHDDGTSPPSASAVANDGGDNDDADDDDALRHLLLPVLAVQAPRVIARFTDVDDRFVRWKAESVIGSYPPACLRERPEVMAALLRCLEHEYACTRGAGLLALGRLRPEVLSEEALRAMVVRLKDGEAAVRWACAHALKKQLKAVCGHPEVAAAVAEEAGRLLGEGEDVWVQREAHRLLKRLPAEVVGAEAADARRVWEARSEAGEDEVMEDAEYAVPVGGRSRGRGGYRG